MDVCALMKEKESQYTSSQYKVYSLIIADPSIVERYTITKIAALAETSTSAVLRFTQVLGFDGYKEFRYALSRQLSLSADTSEDVSLPVFYQKALAHMNTIDQQSLRVLAKTIVDAPIVFIAGLHYSRLPAQYLVMKLTDMGIPAIGSYDAIDITHCANLFSQNSVFIMFSISGNMQHNRALNDVLSSSLNDASWLITCFKNAQYKKIFPHLITLPTLSSTRYKHADAHPLMMIFVEMLIDEIDWLIKEGV